MFECNDLSITILLLIHNCIRIHFIFPHIYHISIDFLSIQNIAIYFMLNQRIPVLQT